MDAAEVLSTSLPWDVDNYSVCDNVDLKIILEEYASYHQVCLPSLSPCWHYSQVKYGKRPDICRRNEKDGQGGDSIQGSTARRKRAQRALNSKREEIRREDMKRSPSVNNNSRAAAAEGLQVCLHLTPHFASRDFPVI